MHERQGRGRPGGMVEVHLDGGVGQLFDEIALPVPLEPRREQRIEKPLDGRKGHRPQEFEDRRRQIAMDRVVDLAGAFRGTVAAGNDGADLLAPERLGERRRRRNGFEAQER